MSLNLVLRMGGTKCALALQRGRCEPDQARTSSDVNRKPSARQVALTSGSSVLHSSRYGSLHARATSSIACSSSDHPRHQTFMPLTPSASPR